MFCRIIFAGDHFAACVEYVLKFSPLLSPDPLFISQQVGGWTIQNQQSSRTLKKAKGEFGSFALEKGGMMSEVIVKLIDSDVLIKRFSSYQINRKGRIKELPDSDIERLVADFKKSSFDYYTSTELQELILSENCHKESLKGPNVTNAVHESMLQRPVLLGMDISARKVQKWRVSCSIDLKHEKLAGNKVQNRKVPLKRTNANGSNCERKKQPWRYTKLTSGASLDRASLDTLHAGDQTTEVDGKMPASRNYTNTTRRNVADSSTFIKSLTIAKTAEPAQTVKKRLAMSKGDTAGECDFLFKANAKQSLQGSLDYAWTHVHHWEVSVHFLLYVGPWEVFGLPTSGSSVWYHSGKKVLSSVEGIDPIVVELQLGPFYHFLNSSAGADETLVLDACYVAPSVGDTWFDRKRSMSSKLQLSCHSNTAAKISNLFHSSLLASNRRYKPLRGSQLQRYDKYRADPSIIRVIPRALTKGYLFYEPQLWFTLCMQRDQGTRPMSLIQTKRDDDLKTPKNLSTSFLNVDHWMGWWVYASDFAEFARCYGHTDSMWYIAPRNEWLAPIIINCSEMHRCRRVFDIVGMLTMIIKVGEEAASLQPSRERRFMVVEVCWNPDVGTTVGSVSVCKCTPERQNHQQKHAKSLEEKGSWVEVSRGFIVEKTWPDSREQLAHGFTLSWSPVLLGWS
ncbi:hypothetical protein L7F22_046135 [Adiantum nelumboides]|nr:hypothetical protein [Adiantum nelumboides]MCO5592139.1 hypothetical protein [Adiantum nelumboides]